MGNMITNDKIFTREIKFRISNANETLNKKNTMFISTLDLNFRKKLVKFYIWIISLYYAEN